MYVNVDGSRKSSATSTVAAITMRLTFCRPPMSGSKRIAPIRSDIVLAIDDLLVAVRAHLLSAHEAYQLVFGAAAMDRTRQLGRTLDALAILRLAEPDARWREVDDHPIKKGATRRDQRDEEHPFHYDGTHWSALPWRDSARRRCTSTTRRAHSRFRPRFRPRALRSAPSAQELSGRPNSSCTIPTPSGLVSTYAWSPISSRVSPFGAMSSR